MNTIDEKVHVGVVLDQNVVELAIIMAISLFRTTVARILHLHIVCDQLQDTTKTKIQDILAVEQGKHVFDLIDVDSSKLCDGLPGVSHFTKAAYVRLFFPEIFPELHRMVYLDTDILAVRDISTHVIGDFSEPIAAVADELNPGLNSGVMIMNFDNIRSTGVFLEAIKWIRKNPDTIRFCDQDGLRAVIGQGYHHLPFALNTTCIPESGNLDDNNTVLLHYAGAKHKPNKRRGFAWHNKCGLSAKPWINFRETTALRVGFGRVNLLKFQQLGAMLLRACIFRPQKFASRWIRKKIRKLRG